MTENRLRDPRVYTCLAEPCRVRMAKGVPRQTRQPQRFPGGFEHAVTQVLGTEWRSLRCGEHEVFRLRPPARSPMNFEQSHKRRAHRNNALAASRFRRPKPVRIGFLDRERLTEKINTPPPDREDFTDPESREHSHEYNC